MACHRIGIFHLHRRPVGVGAKSAQALVNRKTAITLVVVYNAVIQSVPSLLRHCGLGVGKRVEHYFGIENGNIFIVDIGRDGKLHVGEAETVARLRAVDFSHGENVAVSHEVDAFYFLGEIVVSGHNEEVAGRKFFFAIQHRSTYAGIVLSGTTIAARDENGVGQAVLGGVVGPRDNFGEVFTAHNHHIAEAVYTEFRHRHGVALLEGAYTRHRPAKACGIE